jgi:Recombinase
VTVLPVAAEEVGNEEGIRMAAANRAQAGRFAANVLPIIREVQAAGHASCNAIAGQLNARKVATARGGRWTHVQVRQILDRSAISDATVA